MVSGGENDPDGGVDLLLHAPAWRCRLARVIDAVAALAVLSLFLTPMIAVQGYDAAPPVLKGLAYVYLGAIVVLAFVWGFKRRHQREYVTIGMSIMELRPVRTGQVTRLVQRPRVVGGGTGLSTRLAAAVGMPLMLLAIGFLVYELVVYV